MIATRLLRISGGTAWLEDYRRFTLDGLREIAGGLVEVDAGWRTGPTANVLVFVIET